MRIQVYEEQYKTSTPHVEPGKVANEQWAHAIEGMGNLISGAIETKLENDDKLNSARVEADTMYEADKMLRDFKSNADPENFEQDMANQRTAIQDLIKTQSKQFHLSKNQRAFSEKMTRGLETNYIGQALTYSYKLQDEHAKSLVQSTIDSFKAQLLAGNSLITPQSVIQSIKDYAETVGGQFKVDKDTLNKFVKQQVAETITSYAYGIIDTDPVAIKNMLLGDNFDKFKAAQEEAGSPFTMEQFWTDPELQKAYRESEYGANWTDISEYLDYPTRMQLWKVAEESATKREKEQLKQTLMSNAYTDAEVDQAFEAAIAQAENDGTLPALYRGFSKVTSLDDPELGSKNEPIKMGEAKIGPLQKGNSITKEGKTFANGIDGGVRGQGYTTYITSNLRPGDKDSKHSTASAVDIQIFKKNEWSLDGSIKAYAEAVKKYGNHMRKGGTLFEIEPAKLPYVKAELEKQNIDTSYINWEQSAKYGKSAYEENRQHIHFGIDPKADYTKSNSGSGVEYTFQTQLGKMRYQQLRAGGKDPRNAYAIATKDETKVLAAQKSYTLVQSVITSKNPDGTMLSPSQYGKAIVEMRNSITGNTKMSDQERIIALQAVDYAEKKLGKAQEDFTKDPAGFTETYFRVTDPAQNAAIQQKFYNVAPNEVRTMTEAQAKAEAASLNRMTGEQFIATTSKYSINDLISISKYMGDTDKSGLVTYLGMASPKAKGDIQNCITNWDTVKQFIQQNKSSKVFGKQSDWKAYVQGQLNSDPMMSKYLSDITKTNPQAKTQLIAAMTTLYAYRASQVGSEGNPKAIIKDMVNDFIGENYNTISVRGPFWGGTDVNISRQAYNTTETANIKNVLEVISGLGVNPNKIGAFDAVAMQSGSERIDAASKLTLDKTNKANHAAEIRSSVLTGSYDGLSVSVAYGNTKNAVYSGQVLRDQNGRQIKFQLNDLLELDRQANTMVDGWRASKGSDKYYIPGDGKYTAKRSADGAYLPVSRATAKKAALENLLSNKYSVLNDSAYKTFTKRNVWVSKYENSIYDPKQRAKEEAKLDAQGTPYKKYKGVYDITYDAKGKEISRKRVNVPNWSNNPNNKFLDDK